MTRAERAAAYNKAYPNYPPLHATERWLYGVWDFDLERLQDCLRSVREDLLVQGIWEIGNDYQNPSTYYGAYPKGYVERITSMFPDMPQEHTLHLFAGSYRGPGVRVDVLSEMQPTIVADAERLPFADASFNFVMADPAYSPHDSERYGTKHPNKKTVMHELARVVQPGGHVVWLDIPKPMYRKAEWELWGEIGILRSTMHRGRFAFMFQRV